MNLGDAVGELEGELADEIGLAAGLVEGVAVNTLLTPAVDVAPRANGSPAVPAAAGVPAVFISRRGKWAANPARRVAAGEGSLLSPVHQRLARRHRVVPRSPAASLSSRWHSSSPASYRPPNDSQPSSDGRRIRAGKTSHQTTSSANRTLKLLQEDREERAYKEGEVFINDLARWLDRHDPGWQGLDRASKVDAFKRARRASELADRLAASAGWETSDRREAEAFFADGAAAAKTNPEGEHHEREV
jgi:hypothetical protein